ncbi:gamma-glutamylcyclotransferase [Candidatus Saccharibacteria bacterium]|nr:MAG: gamma-glutamylcyclotransferase [Candidatus Saccharibacteria bacterium]
MTDTVLYFGYGANRDAAMIARVLGKAESELVGYPGVLDGYELAIQRLDQVPDSVSPTAPVRISPRNLLQESWSSDFRSYGIRRNPASKVAGTVWELTPDERERIRDWELIDFGWYEDCEGTATMADGREVRVTTERLGDTQPIERIVDGMQYETWLCDPAKMERAAQKARREYDERMRSPEIHKP